MNDAAHYGRKYFSAEIFETDYRPLAEAVYTNYRPKTLLDVGCGPGKLSLEFANLGLEVTAIDGFSIPDFKSQPIAFQQVDLNDCEALLRVIGAKRYDVAVCLEVAEHLDPAVSIPLIEALTVAAPVVVFSAAVLDQEGHGHINLRPREFWHREFAKRSFVCADRIRPMIRGNNEVARWYQHNVLDYVFAEHPFAPDLKDVIDRLIAAESFATSSLFKASSTLNTALGRLETCPVNWAVSVRNLLRKAVKGPWRG
ncbi:MAG: methyltransferase domain-containing protein [Verrucomicrobiota bacterium]|jgi:SAM-dependent methyltransferase